MTQAAEPDPCLASMVKAGLAPGNAVGELWEAKLSPRSTMEKEISSAELSSPPEHRAELPPNPLAAVELVHRLHLGWHNRVETRYCLSLCNDTRSETVGRKLPAWQKGSHSALPHPHLMATCPCSDEERTSKDIQQRSK